MSILQTSSKLINTSVRFASKAGEKPEELITDYIAPFGEGKNFMPLELFLISLSTCLGGSVSPLLKKMGFSVDGLDIKAAGQRREQHPTSFEKITLDITLTSANATLEDLQKAVTLSEKQFCPVLAMLDKGIEVSYNLKVTNA